MTPVMKLWDFRVVKKVVALLDSRKSIRIQRSNRLPQITIHVWIAQI